MMFFPKLRKRAKWIFVLLAAAFGIGFVGFGVGGTGGGGIADAIGNIFGQSNSTGSSVEEAKALLEENPEDPKAYLEYASALYASQQFNEAKLAYESYLELEPQDTQALRQLALLYQRSASEALARGAALQQDAIQADPSNATLFNPSSTRFTQELARNDIEATIASIISNNASIAFDEAVKNAEPWVKTLERLAAVEPNSPTLQLQIGQAAEIARDTERAVEAYLRALELDPASSTSIRVRDQIRLLGGEVPEELNSLIEENNPGS